MRLYVRRRRWSRAQPDSGPHRPAALVAVPYPDGRGSGRRLDPRRPGDHRRQRGRRHPDRARRRSACPRPGRADRHRLPGRRGRRRAVLRPAVRPARPHASCSSITLGVYLRRQRADRAHLGNGAGWIVFLYVTRFIAGMGIGGEYAAINSAIDELIPARFRGRVDIAVNGTYWVGAILGTLGTLHPAQRSSTRASAGGSASCIGPVLGLVILCVRRHLPESPRWQVMHGREEEAESTIDYIEHEVRASGRRAARGRREQGDRDQARARPSATWRWSGCCSSEYPQRSILGATLMITQSFLYNAIFFTYTLVLGKFYGVARGDGAAVPDRVRGRQPARAADARAPLRHHRPPEDDRRHLPAVRSCCWRSARVLFNAGLLNAITQTIAWCVIFFFASAGRQRGVPHGQRDLPAGGPGQGDRGVLRHRPVLRRARPGALRRADRRRQRPDAAVLRLPARRRRHDRRRPGGGRSSGSTPRASRWRTSPRR